MSVVCSRLNDAKAKRIRCVWEGEEGKVFRYLLQAEDVPCLPRIGRYDRCAGRAARNCHSYKLLTSYMTNFTLSTLSESCHVSRILKQFSSEHVRAATQVSPPFKQTEQHTLTRIQRMADRRPISPIPLRLPHAPKPLEQRLARPAKQPHPAAPPRDRPAAADTKCMDTAQ